MPNLKETLRPDLYRINGFRATGLRVDASPREIARRLQQVEMEERLGGGASESSGPLQATTSLESVRGAVERLRDPESRLWDELFWFWPGTFGQGGSDPGLTAQARGDWNAARHFWLQSAGTPGGSVARHNLAVLAHALALECETASATTPSLDQAAQRQRDEAWNEALNRWDAVLRDGLFWAHLRARITALNEPQLTRNLAFQIRDALPELLAGINAQLAVQAAQKATDEALLAIREPNNKAAAAARARQAAEFELHRQFLARMPFDRAAVDRAVRQALRPIRQRLQGLCQSVDVLKPTDYTHPALQDGQAALLLFQHVLPLPLHEMDRDNLKEAASLALYKFCWFCQRKVAESNMAVGVWFYGRVTRSSTSRGQSLEWYRVSVDVPRCWHCFQAHRVKEAPVGVRPEADREFFPDVQKKLAEGWKIGARPPAE
jgi:hypothetical protein